MMMGLRPQRSGLLRFAFFISGDGEHSTCTLMCGLKGSREKGITGCAF
jgi:hypothetical protein